ncbi:hypothetical protein [Jannaschia sp. M317]|uniref:hypothetical protein n=1 Tax=Jannaschia sp. M317 TaxID=2867011 RepID=UPI0021A8FFAF|nr:hypothetical protein [Jannaschia sp. M317]UWQ16328.1 hypothetical protein K3551_10350 [Jannaschia sp. M317]
MSNPESFIDEVTEEVRRDRLYATLRRWGWVAALVVIVVVGGAAWSEWQKSTAETRAQAFGDSLLQALGADDMDARRAALQTVTPEVPEQAAILGLIRATALRNGDGGSTDAARDELLALAETEGLSPTYRHLALLKVMLDGGTGDAARDGAFLEELATPGAPYRPLAIEQQAITAVRAGDTATAVTLLRVLSEEAGVTESLRRRALQLMVALGASPDPA